MNHKASFVADVSRFLPRATTLASLLVAGAAALQAAWLFLNALGPG